MSVERQLGVRTAALLVVASMVGTGVFTTTGFLVRDLQSAPAVLVAWLLGGLTALCGALSYGELTAALPANGGEYALLSRAYHPLVGFVAGFVSLVVGFAAPTAASAIAFGKYLHRVVPGGPEGWPALAGVALILLTSLLHVATVRRGSRFQDLATGAKVLFILAFVLAGLGRGEPARAEGAPRLPWTADLGLLPAPRLALALAVLAGLALQLPLSEIGNAVHELTPRDLAHERAVRELLDVGSPLEGFAVVGAFVLVAPLMEELLFRGLLLPRLVRAHGVPAGLVVSAALFALVHGRPAPMAYALAAGLVLGALRLRFRSVVPCVALHAATNAVPVLVPPELLRLPGVNVVSEELLHVPLAWLLPAIAVAGAALALLARVPDVE